MGELQNEGNKSTKHDKFSEKRTFYTLWYAMIYLEANLRMSYLIMI